MGEFLDKAGLTYLWGKIKGLLNTKIDLPALPTNEGDYELVVSIDANGKPTYSWQGSWGKISDLPDKEG